MSSSRIEALREKLRDRQKRGANGFSEAARQLEDEKEILHSLRKERSRILNQKSAEDTGRMMRYLGVEDSPFEDLYDGDGEVVEPDEPSEGPGNDDFLSEMQNVSDLIAPVGREEVDITGNILFTTSKLLYISRLPIDPEIAKVAKEIAFAIQTGDREYLAYITAVLQAMVSKEGMGRLEAIRQNQLVMGGATDEEEEVERKRSLLEKIRGR